MRHPSTRPSTGSSTRLYAVLDAVTTPRPVLTVVVPTRDAAATLGRCLRAATDATSVAQVVVVDNHSTDDTAAIARAAGARLVVAGPERSAQRNVGLAAVTTPHVVFLDADMIAGPGVLDEAARRLETSADAVILSEESVGHGYWAAVRREERRCYLGNDDLEACRAFRASFVRALGGFDEDLSAFEDWDLTVRARTAGARIERTDAKALHDEGRLRLRDAVAKKGRYGAWERAYRAKHPGVAARQLSPWRRVRPFVRHAPRLLGRPHLALGVLVLKALEYAASRSRS